jgi:acyl carrier protein
VSGYLTILFGLLYGYGLLCLGLGATLALWVMERNQLEEDLKKFIIATLDLEDVAPGDIDSGAPLFGEGLGLDSIDALELGVALAREYGVELAADSHDNQKHFASVAALAAFVDQARSL